MYNSHLKCKPRFKIEVLAGMPDLIRFVLRLRMFPLDEFKYNLIERNVTEQTDLES